MLRFFDIIFSTLGLIFGTPVFLIILILGFLDTGSPLLFQLRVGYKQKPFKLVKFRTMKLNAIPVATHFADVSDITLFGKFLRNKKLDELPQLWNVLKGDMSLVGPRPCLINQIEIIEERIFHGVFDVRPGITGLAQVNGIDMSIPRVLAITDKKMIEELTVISYFKYIVLTLIGHGAGDRVKE